MKKNVCLFLLLLFSVAALGQNGDYFMFADGRNWRYEYLKLDEQAQSGGSEDYIKYDFVLKVGDNVLFDGHQCKEILSDGMDGTSLYAYGYEEGGCVMLFAIASIPAFFAPFPTSQWVTLYDFNVQKDCHCHMGAFCCDDMIVNEMGLMEDANHKKRRYISLNDAKIPAWPKRYAVEGIGSSFGLFEFTNSITDGSASRFVGCYDGDVCIFSAEDFNTLSMSISVVQMVTGNNEVHDLQGRRIQGKPQKGVYIQDGKKYLVK